MTINKTTKFSTNPDSIPVDTITGTLDLSTSFNKRTTTVFEISDLKNISTASASEYSSVIVTDKKRGGVFVWDGSSNVGNVGDDPAEIIYITPSSDASGASGIWKRVFKNAVHVDWAGAYNDDTNPTSTLSAINNTILLCESQGIGKIEFSEGIYQIDGRIYKPESLTCPIFTGQGSRRTRINSPIDDGTPIFYIEGVAGQGSFCGGYIEDIEIDGNYNKDAFEIVGQIGFKAIRCKFEKCKVAWVVHNKRVDEFTEYCVAEGCEFGFGCRSVMEYRVSSGNDSFHGSGVWRSQVNELDTNTVSPIVIGAGAFVYNSPLDFQIWKYNDNPIINVVSSLEHNNTYGTITVEDFNASGFYEAVASSGRPLHHAGNLISFRPRVIAGNLVLCERIHVNFDNTITADKKKKHITLTTSSNDTTVDIGMSQEDTYKLISGSFFTSNDYQYELILVAVRSPGAYFGSVQTLATLNSANSTGYGTPTFTLNNDGTLTITNNSYGTNPVEIRLHVTDLGGGFGQMFETPQ